MSKVPSLLTLSAVLCAGAAFAEGESVYRVVDDTTLEVTVPAGFTNEFDATYAAALNDSKAREFVLDTSFLGSGAWKAEVFRDKADSDVNPTSYVHETGNTVKAGAKLFYRLAPGGGFIVRFSK